MRRTVFLGCGSYLPDKILTNDDLANDLNTSDEWISRRTGIRQRHIAAKGQLTSDLGVEASKVAMTNAGVTPDDIDLIVVSLHPCWYKQQFIADHCVLESMS